MNLHLFFDPESQSHLPLIEKYHWLIYPGVAVAAVGSEMASRNVETDIDHWMLTITRIATAIVTVLGAVKSIQWAINHHKNSAFNRATAVLAAEKEAQKKHHHHK